MKRVKTQKHVSKLPAYMQRPEASWRKMLISQPPLGYLPATTESDSRIRFEDIGTPVSMDLLLHRFPIPDFFDIPSMQDFDISDEDIARVEHAAVKKNVLKKWFKGLRSFEVLNTERDKKAFNRAIWTMVVRAGQ